MQFPSWLIDRLLSEQSEWLGYSLKLLDLRIFWLQKAPTAPRLKMYWLQSRYFRGRNVKLQKLYSTIWLKKKQKKKTEKATGALRSSWITTGRATASWTVLCCVGGGKIVRNERKTNIGYALLLLLLCSTASIKASKEADCTYSARPPFSLILSLSLQNASIIFQFSQ